MFVCCCFLADNQTRKALVIPVHVQCPVAVHNGCACEHRGTISDDDDDDSGDGFDDNEEEDSIDDDDGSDDEDHANADGSGGIDNDVDDDN